MSPELHQIIRYFGNDCTDAERTEIEEWKSASEENQVFFNRLKKTWDASEKVPEIIHPDLKNAWRNIQSGIGIKDNKLKQSSMRISINQVLKIAAAIIVVFGLSILVNEIYFKKQAIQIVENLNIAKKEIQLIDGTTVYLNHNSKIYYYEKIKNKTREINLEGEAFFKVAKDARHPFIVHAAGTLIKVLGTSFDIKTNDSSRVMVSVLTGKVSFSSEKNISGIIHLEKGDQGTYNTKTQQINKSKYSDENFLAWETGKLHFNNQILEKVSKVLSDYYSTKIEVSPDIQNRLITVSFDNQPLHEVLKILELTLNIKINNRAGKIVLETSRNN